jgi:hypothetical protein
MAINVQGGGLFFDSGIDLEKLQADANKASNIVSGIGAKGLTSFTQQLKEQSKEIEGFTTKAARNIETLRGMKLARENFIINETDLTKIAKYNQEIEVLTKEINRLSNAGKTGFDALGQPIKNVEAIGNAAEASATKTNFLTKGFSFFRQAAYLIPGIGIAGIFNIIGEGVVKLATNLFSASKGLGDVKSKSDLLAESQQKIADGLATGEAKFRPYLDALNKANLSEKDRFDIYNQIKLIDPQILAGIDAKTLSYEKLANNVNSYLNALRSQLTLEANKDAVISSIKQEQSIQKQIDLLKKRKQASDESAKSSKDAESRGLAQFTSQEAETDIKVKERSLAEQKKVTEDLGKLIVSNDDKRKRSVDVIDQQISALRKEQSAISATRKEYTDFQTQIDKLEAERKTIVGESKSDIKSAESAFNQLLEQRKDLLKSIEALQRDAFQSGLVKEQSAVDKVREKYDLLINKVEEFNKKAKAQRLPGIAIDPITQARDTEVSNTIQKQQADEFIKSIEKQKDAFDRFEKYKLSVGPEKAKLLASEEIKGFDNYISFLQTKLEGLANDQSIKAVIEKAALSKLLEQAKSDKTKQDQEEQAKNLQDVLSLTGQFEFQKNQIELKFSKLRTALQKSETTMTGEEFKKRSDELEKLHQNELTNLQITTVKQGELYKKIGQDLLLFSRDQLKERLADLKNTLANDKSLSPQMKKDVKAAIDALEGLIVSTDETIQKLDEFIEKGSKIKDTFDNLASAVEPLNKNLAQAVTLMSQLMNSTLNVAQGLKAFQTAKDKGDKVGQISAATDIFSAILTGINAIVSGIKKTQEEIKRAKQAVADFQSQLIAGEFEYQALLRERARAQVTLNKLTLDALDAQKKLLEEQKKSTAQSASDLLKQIQSLTFVSDVQTKKKGLFSRNLLELFSGGDQIKQVTESLAGKTFDQLEELFTKGQLTGKAKELFEQLQKIKKEGVDIDQQLADLKKQAAETFTGTTAESITDTIAQGFKNGLHSASDFAGNFEDLMRDAIINSLKFKFLEGPIKDLFDQFAAASESGSGLTKAEIDDLQKKYNAIINDANKKFQDLQQIAGLNFSSSSQQNQNVLQGSFSQLTEDTGNQLLGAFNGQRAATLNLVEIQKNALGHLNAIENNTAATVSELQKSNSTFITYFRDIGVKMK